MKISVELVEKTKGWLQEEGIKHFRDIKETHGEIAAVFMEGSIPHAVHFNEGMSVRNFMRQSGECKNWTAHEFDDNWESLIEKVIK